MILTSFIETASDHNSQQDFFGFPENHCNEVTTNGPNKKLHALQSKCSDRSKVFNPIKAISSILLLCTLLLVNPANASDNIALNKPTSQSSIAWGGLASRAVDGNTSGIWTHNSITHTHGQSNPWWKVDLQSLHVIHEIKIWNRVDSTSNRLSGFKVIVYNKAREAWTWTHGGGTVSAITTLTLPPRIVGDKVEVMIPGSNKILSLAEVEVFGKAFKNIALNKPTSQSSTQHGGSSSRAVDGNTSGSWYSDSITHTYPQTDPWWKVNLQLPYDIKKIKIYNRHDCCSNRLSGFKVTVYNGAREAWTWTHGGGTVNAITTLTLPPSTIGDKVEVRIPGSNKVLSLAEVEVFGKAQNVALNKPTSQSSIYFSGGLGFPDKAVDGITDGLMRSGARSVTHTRKQNNPWWNVDLESQYSISEIKVYDRTDCVGCEGRLSGFNVIVYNEGRATYTWKHGGGTPGPVTTLTLPPRIVGDIVVVLIPGSNKILSLAEVEVFGMPFNVALYKPTYQSSGLWSSRAVDGNTSGSATLSYSETDPWWTVDLQSLYNIKTIKIHNCGEDWCFHPFLRLKSFTVEVYNGATVVWDDTNYIEDSFGEKTLTLPPSINGDKVKVIVHAWYAKTTNLSLAEVEVFGFLV